MPLFLKWPSRIAPNTLVDIPVAHFDLLSTLLLGAKESLLKDHRIDGADLLPLVIRDINGSESWDRKTLYQSSGQNRVLRHVVGNYR